VIKMNELYPMFATPCYGGVVTWQFTNSMINLAESFTKAGIQFKTYMTGGDSVVDRARNDCVAEFLESNCSHLFFIDSDIEFNPQDALDILTCGLDFVLAPYRKKTEEEKWTVTLLEKTTLARLHPRNPSFRFILCAEGGAGFLCLSRSTILRLTEGIQTYNGIRNDIPRRCPDLFKSIIDKDIRIGEDQYLCRYWRAIGNQVWCSVDTKLTHIGSGIRFEGDYAKFIQLQIVK